MTIIVTGTPGTGKTTLAKRLAFELEREYLDINEFAKLVGAIEGRDEARDSEIVDEEKLVAALKDSIARKPHVVIDGHFSHELPSDIVEKCYVTKCSLPILKQRLEARGYSAAKVRENLDAEIFDVCKSEAEENGHTVEVVWSG